MALQRWPSLSLLVLFTYFSTFLTIYSYKTFFFKSCSSHTQIFAKFLVKCSILITHVLITFNSVQLNPFDLSQCDGIQTQLNLHGMKTWSINSFQCAEIVYLSFSESIIIRIEVALLYRISIELYGLFLLYY
jgi:hypothetical protein